MSLDLLFTYLAAFVGSVSGYLIIDWLRHRSSVKAAAMIGAAIVERSERQNERERGEELQSKIDALIRTMGGATGGGQKV